jgi:hypothetical protein
VAPKSEEPVEAAGAPKSEVEAVAAPVPAPPNRDEVPPPKSEEDEVSVVVEVPKSEVEGAVEPNRPPVDGAAADVVAPPKLNVLEAGAAAVAPVNEGKRLDVAAPPVGAPKAEVPPPKRLDVVVGAEVVAPKRLVVPAEAAGAPKRLVVPVAGVEAPKSEEPVAAPPPKSEPAGDRGGAVGEQSMVQQKPLME